MKFFQIFCFSLNRLPNLFFFFFATLKKKMFVCICSCRYVFIFLLETDQRPRLWTRWGGQAAWARAPSTRPRHAGKPSSSCRLSPCCLFLPGSELCGFPLLWLIKAGTSHCLGPTRHQVTVFSFSTRVKKCKFFKITKECDSLWKACTADPPCSTGHACSSASWFK